MIKLDNSNMIKIEMLSKLLTNYFLYASCPFEKILNSMSEQVITIINYDLQLGIYFTAFTLGLCLLSLLNKSSISITTQ